MKLSAALDRESCMRESPHTHLFELRVGRILIALFFAAAAVQKLLNPDPAALLLAGFGMSAWMVWPAMVFNVCAAFCLVSGQHVVVVARSLAFYCGVTSLFHFVPTDPWQMSIFAKNWAIAGGGWLLV